MCSWIHPHGVFWWGFGSLTLVLIHPEVGLSRWSCTRSAQSVERSQSLIWAKEFDDCYYRKCAEPEGFNTWRVVEGLSTRSVCEIPLKDQSWKLRRGKHLQPVEGSCRRVRDTKISKGKEINDWDSWEELAKDRQPSDLKEVAQGLSHSVQWRNQGFIRVRLIRVSWDIGPLQKGIAISNFPKQSQPLISRTHVRGSIWIGVRHFRFSGAKSTGCVEIAIRDFPTGLKAPSGV